MQYTRNGITYTYELSTTEFNEFCNEYRAQIEECYGQEMKEHFREAFEMEMEIKTEVQNKRFRED